MEDRGFYSKIASRLAAYKKCIESGNDDWEVKHLSIIGEMVKQSLPDGSGFDAGTILDCIRSKPDRLVFTTSFHHMDEMGGYDGWTDHDIVVTPSLQFGYYLRVTGKNRDGIKEHIVHMFSI